MGTLCNRSRTLLRAAALFTIASSSSAFAGEVIRLEPGPNLHVRAQEAFIRAEPGTTIEFPEGRHALSDELIVSQSHITVRGQGRDKTVLSFKNQAAGAQGFLATGNAFTIEDLTVEDTRGDAIKVEGSNGVIMRRVRVEWTGGADEKNGAYGFYPVQCRNVLIEDCVVRGASDAGVYVGQSSHIVVRRNLAEFNVAGIEIENSRYADVYENEARYNTGGILVFDLPNLKVQGGRQVRVFRNRIHDNNTKNFAPKGNIVGIIPAGTGFMVMANDDLEIFENQFEGHATANIGIINYLAAEVEITDPNYDSKPERIHIHHNVMHKARWTFFNGARFNTLINLLFGFRTPDIVYDGIEDGTYEGTPLPADRKICIRENRHPDGSPVSFGNMHLDHQRRLNPLPGGPVTRDLAPHDCAHEALPAVALEEFPPRPSPGGPGPDDPLLQALCGLPGRGVNWPALLGANCPRLQDYRLFEDPRDPTTRPRGGLPYELTTPLFTDYAEKHRVLFLPPGFSADYRKDGVLDLPIGTVISKTFSYPHDDARPEAGRTVIETRLLIHRLGGWVALPFVWREDMSEARLSLGGAVRRVEWIRHDGREARAMTVDYRVPSANKCTSCHGGAGGDLPLGPKASLLNRDGQLQAWAQAGRLTGLPADPAKIPRLPVWNDPDDGTLEQRAKAYLEVNCAHCHNPGGRARFSGLFLESERDSASTAYGTCKPPVAAGGGAGNLKFDIVPGKPRKSILSYRLHSVDPAVRMPELGRSLEHAEGAALVDSWIGSQRKVRCGE